MKEKWKIFNQGKFKYWWTVLYFPLYLMAFAYLEARGNGYEYSATMLIDYKIPFVEWFIFPYLMWFPYIAVAFILFFFKDKAEFLKLIRFLYAGMTAFIVTSFIFPNGLSLRPYVLEDHNIATWLVEKLYACDTATNVFPSIHVYNSIVVAVAFCKSRRVVTKKYVKVGSVVLSTAIVLSTMFLKQHSVVDVAGAFILAAPVYHVVYGVASGEHFEMFNHRKKKWSSANT